MSTGWFNVSSKHSRSPVNATRNAFFTYDTIGELQRLYVKPHFSYQTAIGALIILLISVINILKSLIDKKNVLHITFESKGWCFKWLRLKAESSPVEYGFCKGGNPTYPN